MSARQSKGTGDLPSTKKLRASRIAQPIRRTSTKAPESRRSPSINERENILLSAIKQRNPSTSRTSATPLRTPIRQIPLNDNLLFTTEKALLEDKKWLQFQITRLNDYVKDLPDIGKDLIVRGGVKSMTTKQFTTVIQNLLNKIAGKKFKIGTNYIDDIIKALQQLNFPHNISKSTLKTINAPHSFGHIVVLLSWLLDFLDASYEINSEVEDPSNLIGFENDFITPLTTKLFIENAKDGFVMWNNNKDEEFEELKNVLVDPIIITKTDGENIKTINKTINRLEQENEKLNKNKVLVQNHEKCVENEKQIEELKRKIMEMQQYCEEKSENIIRIKHDIKQRNKEIKTLRIKIKEQNNVIQAQDMSVESRNQKVEELNLKKIILDSKMKTIQELEDMGTSNQIIYSRLVKKKIELTAQVNNNFLSANMKTGHVKNLNDFHISVDDFQRTDTEEVLESIITTLRHLETEMLQENNEITLKLSEIKIETQVAHQTVEKLQENINKLNRNHETFLEILLNKINDLAANIRERENVLMNLKNRFEENLTKLDKMRTNLVICKENKLFLSDENVKLKTEIAEKGEEILRRKMCRLNELKKYVANLEVLNMKLPETHKTL